CAKPCAPRSPSRSSPRSAPTAPAAPPATTSTSPSASSAACARSPARWTRSWRRASSSTTAKSAAISSIPSRCCSRSATCTRPKSRATGKPTQPTDEAARERGAQGSGMTFQEFVFWVLAGILVFAALRVITARNPVHCALFLVLAFVSCAGLWLLLHAEFLAIVLVLVYVGAVMVLFLFVVMMLDINVARMREGLFTYLPLGLVVASLMVAEMGLVLWSRNVEVQAPAPPPLPADYSNTKELGRLLYTEYVYPFEIAAVILLVAIVAAIALTLRRRKNTRYQNP